MECANAEHQGRVIKGLRIGPYLNEPNVLLTVRDLPICIERDREREREIPPLQVACSWICNPMYVFLQLPHDGRTESCNENSRNDATMLGNDVQRMQRVALPQPTDEPEQLKIPEPPKRVTLPGMCAEKIPPIIEWRKKKRRYRWFPMMHGSPFPNPRMNQNNWKSLGHYKGRAWLRENPTHSWTKKGKMSLSVITINMCSEDPTHKWTQ